MKKFFLLTLIVSFLTGVSACNNNNNHSSQGVPELIEVELTVTPEKAEVNEPVTLEAKVTQGEENVEDAKEVTFEIWRAHDEKHEKTEVEHTENGIYRFEKSFQEEGTYYIISHVTARDMHSMPKKEFIIGTPSEPEDQSKAHDSMEGMEGH